jgi:hypothetical protein
VTPRQWAREHQAIAALALGLVAALALEGALLMRLGPVRKRAADEQKRLGDMEAMANRIIELRLRQDAGGPKFLSSGTRFNAEAVDRVAREHKLVERGASPSVKVETSAAGTRETVVSLSAKGLAPAELDAFLKDVEALDPAVRTRKLSLTANGEKPLLINATVEISAYEAPDAATN